MQETYDLNEIKIIEYCEKTKSIKYKYLKTDKERKGKLIKLTEKFVIIEKGE